MLADIAPSVGASLAYSVLGIALMVLGFGLVDLLTPGDLRTQVWVERNRNAALLVSSNLLGVGIIVATAVWSSQGAIGEALLSSLLYGLVGLLAMAVAFWILDKLTPGDFGEVVAQHELHPAVWVSAAVHLGIALVIAAALT